MSATTIEAHPAPVAVEPSAAQDEQAEAPLRSLRLFLDGAGRSLLRPGARTAAVGQGAEQAASALQARGFDAVAMAATSASEAQGPRFDCAFALGKDAAPYAFSLVKKHGLVVVLGAAGEDAAAPTGAAPTLCCPRSGALCYSGEAR